AASCDSAPAAWRSRPRRAPARARTVSRARSWRTRLPAACQHVEHVGHLLSIAQVAEMPAMIIDRNSRAQGALQPGELLLVENEIIAVGLRVVVRVVAQRGADEVETVFRNQRILGQAGPAAQIVRRKDSLEIFRKWHSAQLLRDVLQR